MFLGKCSEIMENYKTKIAKNGNRQIRVRAHKIHDIRVFAKITVKIGKSMITGVTYNMPQANPAAPNITAPCHALIHLKRSRIIVMMHEHIAMLLPMPSTNNMKKNKIANAYEECEGKKSHEKMRCYHGLDRVTHEQKDQCLKLVNGIPQNTT